jgi:hypothetical protein
VTLVILGVQAAAGALFAGALQLCWRTAGKDAAAHA